MLNTETLITLQQAAEHLPNKPNPSTLWRWCRQGLRGVCLEYRRVGRAIFTSLEALDRFTAALTQADQSVKQTTRPVHRNRCIRSSAAERMHREATLALKAAGF